MTYRERTRARNEAAREWHGSYRPYDLIKEATIALGVVTVIAVLAALLFSSPDERPTTVQSWARSAPVDFVTTAMSELDGTSTTAGYGPPYNHNSDGQHLLFIYLQKWLGVAHPVNAANDFVINPLRAVPGAPALHAAVNAYSAASPAQRARWDAAYSQALSRVHGAGGLSGLAVPGAGPVPAMMSGLLADAQGGGLDGALTANRQFYSTDPTKSLLFLSDGGVLAQRAQAEHLLGDQWGMMNETGSFPGQSWLWLYTFWYQIKPFSTSANADILVIAMMTVLSLLFVLVPFIPGVRDLPRAIPIYRLIWREHYRSG